jgi:hypothetical protein
LDKEFLSSDFINETVRELLKEELKETEDALKEGLTVGKKITKRSDLKKLVADLYNILPEESEAIKQISNLLGDGILSIKDMETILSANGEDLYSSLLSYGYSLSEFLESSVRTPAEILTDLGESFSVN